MTINSVHEIFGKLAGRWKLDRVIPAQGIFNGEVVFTKENDTRMRYDETGILSLDKGGEMNASRSYIYELNGESLTILYNDPYRKDEVMHELFFTDQDGGMFSRHCHLCGDDKYDLTFVFNSDGHIEMNYVIKGPMKDYCIESVLTPL